jgi:hypothetical protein
MAPITTLIARNVLEKRDNMGFAMSPMAIVALALAGAGVALVMAYGLGRFFFSEKDPPPMEASASQLDYMREVRSRNLDGLMADGAHARYHGSRADVQR